MGDRSWGMGVWELGDGSLGVGGWGIEVGGWGIRVGGWEFGSWGMGDVSWGMGVWDLGMGNVRIVQPQKSPKHSRKIPQKFIKTVITTSQWRFLPSHLVCQRIRACATY